MVPAESSPELQLQTGAIDLRELLSEDVLSVYHALSEVKTSLAPLKV
jgi:hypothetical protein